MIHNHNHYLVTGGAGFIGSHLAARLVHDGRTVRVLDNLSSGAPANLATVRGDIELITGDLRDRAALTRALRGVEVVFHLAAEPSVPKSVADPATTFEVNITGTLTLLTAARDAGCRRLVFASTCAVYGDAPESPKVETMAPRPLSPYAISKLTGEQLCGVFSTLYGFETVALRYFNVFGPRQDPASAYAAVVPRFLAALRDGRRPVVYGDGEQSRDFVFVDDVVAANLLAAECADVAGQVFNVASGQPTTVNAILGRLGQLLGRRVSPIYEPARPGDVRHSLADTSAARRGLGFAASVPFEVGLARLVAEAADQAKIAA